MSFAPSELVLNEDGSIYHLHLQPEQLADTVITVGDPDRVAMVSKYFDRVEHRVQKREFITHTGYIGERRLTALSTGIGTDNIDIVINELDALATIDLDNRRLLDQPRQLRFIRLGTSGGVQRDLDVGTVLLSSHGLGLDGLLNYYDIPAEEEDLLDELTRFLATALPLPPYLAAAHADLLAGLRQQEPIGITLSTTGFYAPQGRELRLRSRFGKEVLDRLAAFRSKAGLRITNFEMETAALYGLANALGHGALSANLILANRPAGTFHRDPYRAIDAMIREMLERIVALPA
jgi:uridine phosphorylase